MLAHRKAYTNQPFRWLFPFTTLGCSSFLRCQSVFAQTFTDWELLLLDDGGTDGSVESRRASKTAE